MPNTRTGNFPIGFRLGWSPWQQDLPAVLGFAVENGFGVIDIGRDTTQIAAVQEEGLRLGSVDLAEWQGMLSPDPARRAEALARNVEQIHAAGAAGARNFFVVLLPEDPARPRRENFGYAVQAAQHLAPALEAVQGRLVIEGWPGPGAQCCTPETVRALFQECPSPAIGLNYDPSHLLRMGIDPLRFLREFVSRVGHVHGKDAEILPDNLYEFGWEQPATFQEARPFGSFAWRYTIPGRGQTDWPQVFHILQEAGYEGAVCIELEDADFNGSEEGEKRGVIEGARFLNGC